MFSINKTIVFHTHFIRLSSAAKGLIGIEPFDRTFRLTSFTKIKNSVNKGRRYFRGTTLLA